MLFHITGGSFIFLLNEKKKLSPQSIYVQLGVQNL